MNGSLALAPGQGSDDAFDRLEPLFRERGTSHERGGDTLTFRKKDQAAQDKMSVFDSGVLRIERDATGPVLRYRLTSRALLFCFLAPLLFLGLAQLNIVVSRFEPSADVTGKGAKHGSDKSATKKADVPMNPIDKALGAPAPEKKGADKPDGKNKKLSPTAAYVFAAIFAVLYAVGRVLEARLVKKLFRKALSAA